jgi:hypothetical protein
MANRFNATAKATRESLDRLLVYTLLTALVIAIVGLVILSPLGLGELPAVKNANWVRLANIGQTYGAVSAVISGIALGAVSVSLILQAHALRLSRVQAMRTYHFDLIKLSLQDPSLVPSWGSAPAAEQDLLDLRQAGYSNMIVSFWQMLYVTRTISEAHLRDNLSTMFRGQAGREFWAANQSDTVKWINQRKDRRFVKIVNEEYARAIQSGPPRVLRQLPGSDNTHGLSTKESAWDHQDSLLITAVGVGVVIGELLHRLRRGRA